MELRQEIMHALAKERISWVDPKNFHITLRFLGDTSPGDVDKIAGSMNSAGFRQNSRHVPVSGVGSFGPARRPRVIWAAFGQELWIREIKSTLDEFLEDLGFSAQNQDFTPHLTLGRIRSLKDVSAYHKIMKEIKGKTCEAVEIDRIIYYRSMLGPKGPQYSILSEVLFN